MFVMQTGMIGARSDMPTVFGYFSENPKTSYLIQSNNKRMECFDLENDTLPTLSIVLKALVRIIRDTELTSHTCHADNIIIKWEDRNVSLSYKAPDIDQLWLGNYNLTDNPREEVCTVLERIIRVLDSHWDMLNNKVDEMVHIHMLRDLNKELNPDGSFTVFSTSRMAISECVAVNQWFSKTTADKKLFLTLANMHEVFFKCVTAKDSFLIEFIEALEGLNEYGLSLKKLKGEPRDYRYDFKNSRLILSMHSSVWYEEKDEAPYYNALLVGQSFNNASRISFTAYPNHIKYIIKMLKKSQERLVS